MSLHNFSKELYEQFPNLQAFPKEIVSSRGVSKCFFCGEDSKVIITKYKDRIIKLCNKCNFNYTYDWSKEDLVSDNSIYEFFKSLQDNKPQFSVIILSYTIKKSQKNVF